MFELAILFIIFNVATSNINKISKYNENIYLYIYNRRCTEYKKNFIN